jgi:hypothetical protein
MLSNLTAVEGNGARIFRLIWPTRQYSGRMALAPKSRSAKKMKVSYQKIWYSSFLYDMAGKQLITTSNPCTRLLPPRHTVRYLCSSYITVVITVAVGASEEHVGQLHLGSTITSTLQPAVTVSVGHGDRSGCPKEQVAVGAGQM